MGGAGQGGGQGDRKEAIRKQCSTRNLTTGLIWLVSGGRGAGGGLGGGQKRAAGGGLPEQCRSNEGEGRGRLGGWAREAGREEAEATRICVMWGQKVD